VSRVCDGDDDCEAGEDERGCNGEEEEEESAMSETSRQLKLYCGYKLRLTSAGKYSLFFLPFGSKAREKM
jgi:hypothetical protein